MNLMTLQIVMMRINYCVKLNINFVNLIKLINLFGITDTNITTQFSVSSIQR